MKTFKIELQTPGVTAVLIQQRASGPPDRLMWREMDRIAIYSGSPRTILLEENERLIIDSGGMPSLIVDRAQNAVSAVNMVSEPMENLPPGPESAIGVWREGGEQLWSRTGERYKKA